MAQNLVLQACRIATETPAVVGSSHSERQIKWRQMGKRPV